MKTSNPVVWFEIYVDDLQRAKKFYENVLDIHFTPLPNPTSEALEMLAFPGDMESKNLISGALVKKQNFKAGNNSTMVYFMSEDCKIEEKKIKEAGGSIVHAKISLGHYGYMIQAIDTEGNNFGVHSMK